MPKGKYSRKREFYIYALLDPRKEGLFRYGHWVFHFEPFYIGKGKGKRAQHHLMNCSLSSRSHKNNKIKSIKSKGLEPIIVIKKRNLTEKQALEAEVSLIDKIGRSNLKTGPLTNLTDGGEGTSGKITTEECKAKLRAVAKAKPKEYWIAQRKLRSPRLSNKEKKRQKEFSKCQLGVKQSDETIAKRVASRKGYRHSEATKQKMREARKGFRQSEETKAKLRAANLGHKVSEETKEKIRAGLTGRKQSEQHRLNVRKGRGLI